MFIFYGHSSFALFNSVVREQGSVLLLGPLGTKGNHSVQNGLIKRHLPPHMFGRAMGQLQQDNIDLNNC